MTYVISTSDLPFDGFARELQGYEYGDTRVSLILIEAPPGSGPKLHSHPYEEIFIVQEGQVTFSAGGETIEATAGQVVIVPGGTPHKFVNSGAGPLRQVDIHVSPRFITNWLE